MNAPQIEPMVQQLEELKKRLDRLENFFQQVKLHAFDDRFLSKDYLDAFISFLEKVDPKEVGMLHELKCMASLLDQGKLKEAPTKKPHRKAPLQEHSSEWISSPIPTSGSHRASKLKGRAPIKRMI